jgi:hypothetical protein
MKRFIGGLVLLCALTACGNGGGSSGTQQTGSPSGETQSDVLLQYAQCMRENGVQVPDPEPGDAGSLYAGVDKNSPAFQSANKVCGPILQGVAEDRKNNNGKDAQQQQGKLLTLAQCLRDHGVNVPDPVAGAEKPFGDSLDRTNPAVAKAIQACNAGAPTPPTQG